MSLTWLLFNCIDDLFQCIFKLYFTDRLKSFCEVLNGFTGMERKDEAGHWSLRLKVLCPKLANTHQSGTEIKI